MLKYRLKELVCRWFGHKVYVERFAIKVSHYRYHIVERRFCDRCGKELESKLLAENISRAQMLHDGWFIEK